MPKKIPNPSSATPAQEQEGTITTAPLRAPLVAGLDESQSAELLKHLREDGYRQLRVLEDGTVVGVGALMFTTALYIGLTGISWERRYCYPSITLALDALMALKTGDDFPLEGYVAKRGIGA